MSTDAERSGAVTGATADVLASAKALSPSGVSEGAVDDVIQFEQSGTCATVPYLDPKGIPTIGYGSIWDRRCTPMARVTMETPPVDEAMARAWMRAELSEAAATLARDVKVPLDDGEHFKILGEDDDFLSAVARFGEKLDKKIPFTRLELPVCFMSFGKGRVIANSLQSGESGKDMHVGDRL